MCCPCTVIYLVHSRAHTHAYISDTIVHMQTCIVYHLWHNFPEKHKLDSFSTFVVWGQALFLFRQASRPVLSVSSILPALWFIQEMELHSPMDFEKWFCAEYFCTLNGVCALCCAPHVRAVQPDGPHDWYDAHGKRVLRIDLWIYELVTS